MNKRFKMISNIIMLSLTALLLVMLSFGWYVVNKQANVEAVTGLTASNDGIILEDTVIAKIYYLKGDITTETYTRTDTGKLYLVKREFYVPEGTTPATQNYTVADEVAFSLAGILPGEYVDITMGYSMADSFDGSAYSIGLMNVTGGSFTLDSKTHYATGAFKWKNINLKSGNITVLQSLTTGTVVNSFGSATYSWIGEYDIDENDEENLRVTTLNHTWDSDYTKLFYTFRIFEDFTQYYDLVGQSPTYTGDALLSFKKMNIGNVFVMG